MQRSWAILTLDQSVGWFQKKLINTTFENSKVSTDTFGFRNFSNRSKFSNDAQTIVLGPSSAFGWGVDDDLTYSALLNSSQKLGLTFNMSGIGHTASQGQSVFEKLDLGSSDKLKNIIFAYGINELDQFRFFDQKNLDDMDFMRLEPKYTFTELLLHSFSLGQLIQLTLFESKLYFQCQKISMPKQRLQIDQLLNIYDQFMNKHPNLNYYFLNTVFALPQKYKITQSKNLIAQSEKYYQQALVAAQNNNCSEFIKYFNEARKLEPYRIHIMVNLLNKKMADWSKNKKIHLIDINSEFEKSMLISPENNLFFDPVHPNRNGHDLIAHVILESIHD